MIDQPFQDYRQLIYYVLRKLRIPEPYEDHLQEAYFVYKNSVHKHDPSKSKFSTFFTYELFHHYKTFLRKQQRYETVIREYHANHQFCPSVPDTIHEQTLIYDLSYHYGLTDFERDILLLSYQGFTVDEITRLRNVSPSTIKRTRKKIKGKIPRDAV